MKINSTLTKMNTLVYDCGGQIVKTYAEAQAYKARTRKPYTVKYEPVYEQIEVDDKMLTKRVAIQITGGFKTA